MTEHIREEYALRLEDGALNSIFAADDTFKGIPAREYLERIRDETTQHNLTVVHRTVTFTDWEEVQ